MKRKELNWNDVKKDLNMIQKELDEIQLEESLIETTIEDRKKQKT